MNKKVPEVLEYLFSIFAIIAILGGVVVFSIFLIAIIIGGELGSNLAVSAKSIIMPIFIRIAAISVFSGLIFSYMVNKHAFSIKKEKD